MQLILKLWALIIKEILFAFVQISSGDEEVHLIQINRKTFKADNLKKILEDNHIKKIFQFARFDLAVLNYYLKTDINNVYCTKIASKIGRTYTDKHGLKDLCKELLNIELSKQMQSSDWGAEILTEQQINYAASDVLYLHKIKEELDKILIRENRMELAEHCFKFLKHRVTLDLAGWNNQDIFAH
ncbi:MAG: hypothetical protein RLZ08_130 [Pseudomonadota bacterium]